MFQLDSIYQKTILCICLSLCSFCFLAAQGNPKVVDNKLFFEGKAGEIQIGTYDKYHFFSAQKRIVLI
jgi:predicted naringenin-chalcone synthase